MKDSPLGTVFETASEAENRVDSLRQAVYCGDWNRHRQLAVEWSSPGLSSASLRVRLAIAEHAILAGEYYGAYANAEEGLNSEDPGLALAASQIRLRCLLACGAHADGPWLTDELSQTVHKLEPLLRRNGESGSIIPANEWRERTATCRLLLTDSGLGRRSPAEGDLPGHLLPYSLLQSGDPEGALRAMEDTLHNPPVGSPPERLIRLSLLWSRWAHNQYGRSAAQPCETTVDGVIEDTVALDYPTLEMEARAQRAFLRGLRDSDGRIEAFRDAGLAANIAMETILRNHGTLFERPLRTTLLNVLDQALRSTLENSVADLPGMGSQRDSGSKRRFGLALLDYADQVLHLALSDSRERLWPNVKRFVPHVGARHWISRLPNNAVVLSYSLVGEWLLIFLVTRKTLLWEARQLKGEATGGEPAFRRPLASLLRERHGGTLADATSLDCLSRYLIPSFVEDFLKRRRVDQLAIVPHDILYRVPFGQLRRGGEHLVRSHSLSIHPTGEQAARDIARKRYRRLPGYPRLCLFQGPDLHFTLDEWVAVREAASDAFHSECRDTGDQGKESFLRLAPHFEILYLACHGTKAHDDDPETTAMLRLGRPKEGVSLAEVASLDLSRTRLVVLQACWTGWLDHLRENPVHGFPQAFRDAGAGAVIAPMYPVHDALCPVFASILVRSLRFHRVGRALRETLQALRENRQRLSREHRETAGVWTSDNIFDDYEYRLIGDPHLPLSSSSRLTGFPPRGLPTNP